MTDLEKFAYLGRFLMFKLSLIWYETLQTFQIEFAIRKATQFDARNLCQRFCILYEVNPLPSL